MKSARPGGLGKPCGLPGWAAGTLLLLVSAIPYLSPPGSCERLESIVRRFGGSLAAGFAAVRIEYTLPTHAKMEVVDFLRGHAQVITEPTYQAQLPGGLVYGSGNVLSPDGRSIARDVSEDLGKPFTEHWLLTYRRIRPHQLVSGTTAVIATTLGMGYSHWLLEELPRLLAANLEGCDALIANTRQAFAREALRHHGFSGRVLPVKREQHFQCEQLVVPSLQGPAGCPTPEIVQRLTHFSASLHDSGRTDFGERLYVSREKARRRRVSNEEALWPQLEARGFRKIFLEDMSWPEQIAVFKRARVVVGPHGAGLANLVFCEEGTRVVEMFGRSYFNPCFWRLAALKGLDYRAVVAADEGPLSQNLNANRRDIEADVAQVLSALD